MAISPNGVLTAAAAAAAAASRFNFNHGFVDSGPACQFSTIGVTAGQSHFTVNQNQWQCFRAGTLKETFDDRVLGKRHGLLGKIEALDLRALLFRPIHVSGKVDQLLIDINAAYAGAAAQCGIEYLDDFHFGSPQNIKK
jgi:hypothetical protein